MDKIDNRRHQKARSCPVEVPEEDFSCSEIYTCAVLLEVGVRPSPIRYDLRDWVEKTEFPAPHPESGQRWSCENGVQWTWQVPIRIKLDKRSERSVIKYELDLVDIAEIYMSKQGTMEGQRKEGCGLLKHCFFFNEKVRSLKITPYPEAKTLIPQEYLCNLSSKGCRLQFNARTWVLDLKKLRPYMYDEFSCRLCGVGREMNQLTMSWMSVLWCREEHNRLTYTLKI